MIKAGSCSCLPGRYGHLCKSGEQHSRGKAHKGYNRPLQEVQLSHQHIGSLCTLWDLFHEVQIHLFRQDRCKYQYRI